MEPITFFVESIVHCKNSADIWHFDDALVKLSVRHDGN
jgi:hypothetical protein